MKTRINSKGGMIMLTTDDMNNPQTIVNSIDNISQAAILTVALAQNNETGPLGLKLHDLFADKFGLPFSIESLNVLQKTQGTVKYIDKATSDALEQTFENLN